MRIPLLMMVAALAAGCGQEPPAPTDRGTADNKTAASADADNNASPAPPPSGERQPSNPALTVAALLGEKVARAQWSKAANRVACAPLGLKSDAKAGGTPRPATFSGGWVVAFDRPDWRSAYGFAGAGLVPEDRADFAVKVDRLTKQWPYIRRWDAADNLPTGSAAGYGLEGAKDYPTGSSGFGQQSLAYLRIPGQTCQYNVWSKLGREHLELLLGELVVLKP